MACFGSAPTITGSSIQLLYPSCVIQVFGSFDIPCGSENWDAVLRIKKGTLPTTSDPIHQTFRLPHGPATVTNQQFNDYSLQCMDPDVYYYRITINCEGGAEQSFTTGSIIFSENPPTLGGYDASIDSEACTFQAQATYNSPCGTPAGKYTAKIFKKKGSPSALGAEDQVASAAIACGISATQIQGNGSIAGKGTHYFTFALYENGALKSSVVKPVECLNCEQDVIPLYPATAIPHESVDELIWLVKPVKSVSGYTYADQRVLSSTYKMVDWWYHRNGGCGPFILVLGETFPELEVALQQGWEIHVRIRLANESEWTTWYRGTIRSGERRQVGQDVLTEIRGQGYSAQLADVYIARRYPKNTYVSQIVADILENYILPNTKIARPAQVGGIGNGIDATTFLTNGPVHFECSAMKALKFLAELEGNMEWGVAANRGFYFRTKKTTVQDVLFHDKDMTESVDAGKEVQKVNQIRVEGKGFGHREFSAVIGDPTDITKYGLFEKPVEVPWIEHYRDALQWAQNIIARRKDTTPWKTISWFGVNKRLERNHPTSGLNMVRIFNSGAVTDYNEFDITKIHYTKGSIPGKGNVKERRRPKDEKGEITPELRAVITTGYHHHDLVEELEEKVYSQIDALKGKWQQFRNPLVDVTLPAFTDVSLYPGQFQGLTKLGSTDVTNGPIKECYWDGQRWVSAVGLRAGDILPVSGDFPGEEFIVWTNVPTRTIGQKYYWTGSAWVLVSGAGGGLTGGGTAYKIPKWLSASSFGDSSLSTDANDRTWTLAPAASVSGNPTCLAITLPAHTTLTAGEVTDIDFNMARTVQFTTGGAIALNRAIRMRAPTYSATASVQTITAAATLAISGGPAQGTNVIIGSSYGLYHESGICRIDSRLMVNEDGTFALRTVGLTQLAASTDSPVLLYLTGGAHTGLNFEVADVIFSLNRTVTWSSSATLATQRSVLINPPTLACGSAKTVTDAATLAITGAPVAGANVTITNRYGLWVQNCQTRLGGNVNISDSGHLQFNGVQSLTRNGTTGELTLATNAEDIVLNPASGLVGINTSSPAAGLEVRRTTTQLRLAYDSSVYSELTSTSDGGLTLFTTGTYIQYVKSLSGDLLAHVIYNSSNTASSSARLSILTGGSSAGDAYILFGVFGVSQWVAGLHNGDGDSFKISNSGFGSVDRFILDTNGIAWIYNHTGTSTTPGANIILTLRSVASGRDVSLQFSDNVANSAYISMVSGHLHMMPGGAVSAKFDVSGFTAIGSNFTPNRTLEVRGTSTQVRIAYDGSVYSEILTDSGGDTRLTNTGDEFYYFKSYTANMYAGVYNSSDNAAAGAVLSAIIGTTTALGDPMVFFGVFGHTNWTFGVDVSDGRKVKLCNSTAAVGTNTKFTVTTGGLVGILTDDPETVVDARNGTASFWGQTTVGTWNNSTAPAHAITISNTSSGGYDATLVFRQATSTGVLKTSGAIDMIGRDAWTNGTAATQISDMLFILRDNADVLKERMRITSQGYVGIGTDNPVGYITGAHGLVVSTNSARATISINSNQTSDDVIGELVYWNAGNRIVSIWATRQGGSTSASLDFATSNAGSFASRMNISKEGYVGIGGTSSATRLEVRDTTSPQVRVAYDGSVYAGIAVDSSGNLHFQPTGTQVDLLNKTTTGGTNTARVVNTDNASGGAARFVITTGGASGGDPYLVFDISGATSWSIGARNSEGDDFIIAAVVGLSASQHMRITTAANVVMNSAAVATGATDGFIYIAGCAGTPTGAPTSFTGRGPLVLDTTNNILYFYTNGAWRNAGSGGTALAGTGTAYKIPKWTGATGIGNSALETDANDRTLTWAPAVSVTGSPTIWKVTGPAHTTLSNAEAIDIDYALNRTVQFAGNTTLATQRAVVVRPPTYSSDTATKTITTAVTFSITGAPAAGTNVTITNAYSFRVEAGTSVFNGLVNFLTTASSSGSPNMVIFTGPAHTTLANAETIDIDFALNRTVQFSGNSTLTTQRAIAVRNPTYSSDTATKTITTAATLAIVNSPAAGTNVTITNRYAFWVQAGLTRYDDWVGLLVKPLAPLHIKAALDGDELYRLESDGGGSNGKTNLREFMIAAATTDATPLNMFNWSPPFSGTFRTVVTVIAIINGIQSGANSGSGFVRMASFRIATDGTITQIGSTSTPHTAEDNASTDATINTSGATIRVNVTGLAGVGIDWTCHVRAFINKG